MSSICGIFSREGKAVPAESIAAMVAALGHWQGDRTGTWLATSGTAALGHVMLWNTPESFHEFLPVSDAGSGLTITADARIDNRGDLFRLLDIPLQQQTAIPDSLLILMAYRKWGRDCPTRLIGDFAFAIHDEKQKCLFCARDQMGIKPLFYSLDRDFFVFATEIKGIFAMTKAPRLLNPNWVADALTTVIADREYTPYPDIWRLPPAHWLSISPAEIKKECYWNLDPEKELHLASEGDYVEAFKEKLEEAVRCRVRSAFAVGSELSGGLDSSAITALAARQAEVQGIKLISFSHVADRSGKDERQFADLLRQHARVCYSHNLYAQNRGIIEALKHSLLIQDGPTMQSFHHYSDVLYEAGAQEGIRTLFSGFGGDEVVSIEAGGYLDELAHLKAWRNLWREYRLRALHHPQYTVKRLIFKIAGEYFPFLKTSYNYIKNKRRETRENSPSFLMETFSLTPGFYLEAGIRQRLAEVPRRPRGGQVRDLQYRRIIDPHVSQRLEYCSIAAAARKIEYRYPLLDTRLLEFHLAVPTYLKRKEGYGRYLFRRAVEGIIPPEIQWRDDKAGMTVPAAYQRLFRDSQEISDLLVRSRCNPAVQYIDLEKMKRRHDLIINMEKHTVPQRIVAFLNALMLLLYFDCNA